MMCAGANTPPEDISLGGFDRERLYWHSSNPFVKKHENNALSPAFVTLFRPRRGALGRKNAIPRSCAEDVFENVLAVVGDIR